MDFPKFEHPDPENRVWHIFKKLVSLDETLKRMKKIQKNEKSEYFVYLVDSRGRSPGHLR